PRHWEEFGDLILLPEGSFQSSPWDLIAPDALWSAVARALSAKRVAVKAEVDEGRMRQSHVTLKFPPGGDSWVQVTQNGITYSLDICRVIRGNVNERARMGTIAAAGETVVDLYAGIGYFTLPLLVQAKCSKLFACEINPDSVEALQRNLLANRVADRCHVLLGDNRETTSLLDRSAHRVLLGLLPSSEQGWPVAVRCLRDDGGWLHVHENVAEADEATWLRQLEEELEKIARRQGRGEWRARVEHVEHVKTYAPRVWHLVADVEMRPREEGS
ncbi:hypothetical protein GUITHDRAFT_71161, partial [Guillardia theta CCMP2712]